MKNPTTSSNSETTSGPDPRLAELWRMLRRLRENVEEAEAVRENILQRRHLLELLSQVDYLHARRISQGKRIEAVELRQKAAALEARLGFQSDLGSNKV